MTDQAPLTVRAWLRQAAGALREAAVPSPEVDARALLEHALGWSAADLLLRADEVIPEDRGAQLATLLVQRVRRVPLQYLLGELEWGGVRLRVDRRALIPRPETEWLLYLALQALEGQQALRVLDVGTGSGALALGLKAACPDAQVLATDLSLDALELARENAALNGLEVEFRLSDLLGPFTGPLAGPFDLILSNPPYLPEADRHSASPEVSHDPDLALYAGADGLSVARPLAAQARTRLAEGGVLLLELDPRNAATLADELRAQGWQTFVHPDLTGRERFVQATPGTQG